MSKSQVNSPRVSEFNISNITSKNSSRNKRIKNISFADEEECPENRFKQGIDLINLNDILGIKPVNLEEQKIKKKIKNLGADFTVTFKENVQPYNPEMYFPYRAKDIEIQNGNIIQKDAENLLGKREKGYFENIILNKTKSSDNIIINNNNNNNNNNNAKPKSYQNSVKKNGFNWNSDKCLNAAIFDWDRDCVSEGQWDCLEIDSD